MGIGIVIKISRKILDCLSIQAISIWDRLANNNIVIYSKIVSKLPAVVVVPMVISGAKLVNK